MADEKNLELPERSVGVGCACRSEIDAHLATIPLPNPVAAARADRPEWATVANFMEFAVMERLLVERTAERDRARDLAARLWDELEASDTVTALHFPDPRSAL